MIVKESIGFRRGIDSKESLGIGDKIVQYEEKMAPYLDKIEAIAIRNGFVPDTNPASDNDNGTHDEENQMTDYTIRNWIKPSKRFRIVKRTARVKIVLRILDDNSWRIEEFPKIHYLLFADPNHPIDKTPQSWKELASGDRFLEWVNEDKWAKEGII